MDRETIEQLIAAIKAQDGEAALAICEKALADAASEDGAHAEPDGDEGASVPTAAAKVGAAPSPEEPGSEGGAPMARAKGGEMDKDMARARKAAADAEGYAAELKAIIEAQRPAAKEQLVSGLRARLGAAFTPAAEKEFLAATTSASFQEAQKLATFTEKMLGGQPGQTRARSGVEHAQNPGPEQPGPKTLSPEQLHAEGLGALGESWIKGYANMARLGPEHAAAYVEQGRNVLRARKAQNGAAS